MMPRRRKYSRLPPPGDGAPGVSTQASRGGRQVDGGGVQAADQCSDQGPERGLMADQHHRPRLGGDRRQHVAGVGSGGQPVEHPERRAVPLVRHGLHGKLGGLPGAQRRTGVKTTPGTSPSTRRAAPTRPACRLSPCGELPARVGRPQGRKLGLAVPDDVDAHRSSPSSIPDREACGAPPLLSSRVCPRCLSAAQVASFKIDGFLPVENVVTGGRCCAPCRVRRLGGGRKGRSHPRGTHPV